MSIGSSQRVGWDAFERSLASRRGAKYVCTIRTDRESATNRTHHVAQAHAAAPPVTLNVLPAAP
jgi:hypothetical protein